MELSLSACKPSSVFNCHLSWLAIARQLFRDFSRVLASNHMPHPHVEPNKNEEFPLSLCLSGSFGAGILSCLASDGVYSIHLSPSRCVGSYPTFPPLPRNLGGIFLLPFSSNYFGLPLASVLLCDARTFLTDKHKLCLSSATV